MLGAPEHRQLAAIDIAVQHVFGQAGRARDAKHWPAVCQSDTQAELASSRADRGLTAAKGGGDGGRRLHTEVRDKVAVVVGCPWRPVFVVEPDAGCQPGGAEAGKVAEHRVLRRIEPRVLTRRTQVPDEAGPVAACSRRLPGCSVEGSKTLQDALSGPPGASSVRSSAKRPLL